MKRAPRQRYGGFLKPPVFRPVSTSPGSHGDKTAFRGTGERFLHQPVYVREVVEKIKKAGALPFVTDTNTLYLGSRSIAVDHITTVVHHGFDYAVIGAPVIIADGLCGKNVAHIAINKKAL